jgi:hypothetical protein
MAATSPTGRNKIFLHLRASGAAVGAAALLAGALAGSQGPATAAAAAADPAQPKTAANCLKASAGARWNTCGYDPVYAYRKVFLDFCGRSPTVTESTAFDRLKGKADQWKPALNTALETCLKSPYWLGTDGIVWQLANPKVAPTSSIKAGTRPGSIPLADFEWDFNLYTYVNSGDRDVRELLTAQYYVKRTSDSPVTLEKVTEQELATKRGNLGQAVPVDKRAGMLTTRWFGVLNTMFTAIPRTTAAAAYRHYLGHNVAKMQGLHPVQGEPVDYDAKGVQAPACAGCHSTLDPMSYPFSRYNGISGAGTYQANRLVSYTKTDSERVVQAPASGMLLGQPVKDLVDWGRVASNSEDFAQKVVFDYWKQLVGREPNAADKAEYDGLWKSLMSPTGSNYRVEKMLHELVLTNAYAAP